MPILKNMTGARCAWCDIPVVHAGSIDHFRPKSRFPELGYVWDNLFPACAGCQKRQDRWDDRLLRPDDLTYSFERYFKYDASTGRIEPSPTAGPVDSERAEVTIALFRLNDPGLVASRRDATRNQSSGRPYRFIGDP